MTNLDWMQYLFMLVQAHPYDKMRKISELSVGMWTNEHGNMSLYSPYKVTA